jgi:hypothetical protein
MKRAAMVFGVLAVAALVAAQQQQAPAQQKQPAGAAGTTQPGSAQSGSAQQGSATTTTPQGKRPPQALVIVRYQVIGRGKYREGATDTVHDRHKVSQPKISDHREVTVRINVLLKNLVIIHCGTTVGLGCLVASHFGDENL